MQWPPIGRGLIVAAFIASSAVAQAQVSSPVTLFSGTNYSGLSRTLNSRTADIRLPFPVRSVRIGRGPGWNLCTRTRMRDCTRFNRDRADVRFVLRSAEPLSDDTIVIPDPGPPWAGGSLRGMASEYFRAPADARGRILSCPSGGFNCARESADRFCRSRGWSFAVFSLQETVNRRNFLADVLCAQTRN